MAEEVGRKLLEYVPEVIVENGGDIFFSSVRPVTVGVYAGGSPLSGKVGFKAGGAGQPLGICTSSGTVGHSLSMGRADAAIVTSRSAALADAVATAAGNLVQGPGDVERALAFALGVPGVLGVVIVAGARMGVQGQIEIVATQQGS